MRIRISKTEAMSRPSAYVNGIFFTALPIWGREEGKRFLATLLKVPDAIRPQRWISLLNKIKRNFCYQAVELNEEYLQQTEPYWGWVSGPVGPGIPGPWKKEWSCRLNDFDLIRSKKPRYVLSLNYAGGKPDALHGWISLTTESPQDYAEPSSQTLLLQLFRDFLLWAKPDFGRMQYYIVGAPRVPGQYLIPQELSLPLGSVFAVMIWGRPFIERFGREKLLATPCYHVEELAPDLIWMQLTPHLFDERGSLESLTREREIVKEHLGWEAFANPTEPLPPGFIPPRFDLRALRQPIDLPLPPEVQEYDVILHPTKGLKEPKQSRGKA